MVDCNVLVLFGGTKGGTGEYKEAASQSSDECMIVWMIAEN